MLRLMEGHIHTTATHGLWILSVVFVSIHLAKTFMANHPDSPIAQALAYYLG